MPVLFWREGAISYFMIAPVLGQQLIVASLEFVRLHGVASIVITVTKDRYYYFMTKSQIRRQLAVKNWMKHMTVP